MARLWNRAVLEQRRRKGEKAGVAAPENHETPRGRRAAAGLEDMGFPIACFVESRDQQAPALRLYGCESRRALARAAMASRSERALEKAFS